MLFREHLTRRAESTGSGERAKEPGCLSEGLLGVHGAPGAACRVG